MNSINSEPIAIIGCGCRFPGGATSPSRLWNLLSDPVDVSSQIPADRFNIDRFYHPDSAHHGTTNVKSGYFIQEDIRLFDSQFFGITPNEADAIDPQQRILLETVFEAMESAGLTVEGLQDSNTAVYVGLMCTDYTMIQARDLDFCHTYGATGTAISNASSRISYFFNWHGPSMTIDTACSSSLVAIHDAVQALRAGTSTVAVAAGTNLMLHPLPFVSESKLTMLSPEGKSRMWDAAADGYARGEGVAAIFMKTLSQAIQDGDNIECIIRETGVNQDGRTTGLTMPSATAQASLIRDTYRRAGLDLKEVDHRPQYFEAHGTGTPAGDPQEAQAIHDAFFGDFPQKNHQKLYVGSAKTVVGHTEGTAGICGILKACLALKNRQIPPNLLFDELSSSVRPFYKSLEILKSTIPWPHIRSGQPRRASVNSFGFGGTNAHAVLESYDAGATTSRVPCSRGETSCLMAPFLFSASSSISLRAQIKNYARFILEGPEINVEDLAYTLSCRRSHLPARLAITATSLQELGEKLQNHALQPEESQIRKRITTGGSAILLVFTGQGAQWPGMGARLIACSSSARRMIQELDESLSDLPENDRPAWSIENELRKQGDDSRLSEAAYAQPLCTAVQIILVQLLKKANITFQAVVGHSSGEIAASFAAGFFSARDAIRIAYYRGLHAQVVKGGAMMAVATTLKDAEELCATEDFTGRLCIAASNSPLSVTLSGDVDAIQEAKTVLDEEKKVAKLLRVDTAYHSHHMQRCADGYRESLTKCNITMLCPPANAPKWHSSVFRGQQMSPVNISPTIYWTQNMVETVLFSQAIETALADQSFDLILEIGPHPTLASPVKQIMAEIPTETEDTPYVGLLQRNYDDVRSFSEAIGQIWTFCGSSGILPFEVHASDNEIQNFRALEGLPLYAWHHDRTYWSESRSTKLYRTQADFVHGLLGIREPDGLDAHVRWRNVLKVREIPWLSGHQLQGQTVFPATGFVALAVEAAMQIANGSPVQVIDVLNLSIEKAIAVNEVLGTELVFALSQIRQDTESHRVTAEFMCHTANGRESTKMQLNAKGNIEIQMGQADKPFLSPYLPTTSNFTEVDVQHFYSAVKELGYGYEGIFRGLSSLKRRAGQSVGSILPPPTVTNENQLVFHPAMLDTALQGMIAAFSAPGDGTFSSIHAPKTIRRVSIEPKMCGKQTPKVVGFDSVVTTTGKGSMEGDIDVFSPETGFKMIQIEGLSFVRLSPAMDLDDTVLFSESIWGVDRFNGHLASDGRRATTDDHMKALNCERVAYFYFRTLNNMFGPARGAQIDLTWNHKALLDYAAHICQQVTDNSHPFIKQEWSQDTHQHILDLVNSYSGDVDFDIMYAVGEALPHVISGQTTILEHMTKDGLLDKYYKNALGFEIGNEGLAALVEQISFRYPHMNILEIGAGTGGSTHGVLDKLGTAFTSYTFTDISSSYFEVAKERFGQFSNRMVYGKLDIASDPIEQGYAASTYDMIIASNVLHATRSLEQTLRHVRTLLKPGGFLLLLEIVDNGPSRVGLTMGGLPGWWIGIDDGRKFAPTISLEQWRCLLEKTGFSGIDTHTPVLDSLPWPGSAIVSQAVDEKVNILRAPLSCSNEEISFDNVVLLGGSTFVTRHLIEETRYLLVPRCRKITHIQNLETLAEIDIPTGSALISVADVDAPIFEGMTNGRFEMLQRLLLAVRDVVWVTKDYQRQNPYAALTVGMCRSVQIELSHLRLQLVDFGPDEPLSAKALTELCLRLQYTHNLDRTGQLKQLIWTFEPEILFDNGLLHVLRVKPQKAQNDRHNSTRRRIFKDLDLKKSVAKVQWASDSYELLEVHRQICTTNVTQKHLVVECSISHSIRTQSGHLFCLIGTNMEKMQKYLAFSYENASEVTVPESCIMPIDVSPGMYAPYLSLVVCHLLSQQITKMTPKTGTTLVHDPDPFLASILTRQFMDCKKSIIFTSSQGQPRNKNWLPFHIRSPDRLICSSLPQDVSCFFNLSSITKPGHSLGETISRLLPETCGRHNISELTSRCSSITSWDTSTELECLLQSASQAASVMLGDAPADSVPLELITPKQLINNTNAPKQMKVIDWRRDPLIPALVEPMSNRMDLLHHDKTYWLVGLAGDMGKSLVDWMVEHGARHVVLSSRNPKIEHDWLIEHQLKGAKVEYIACDITSAADMKCAHANITANHPEIGGVANGALILRDQSFATMTLDSFQEVCKPKVEGILHLQELFRESKLDFFIAFSSVVSVVGNAGQCAYSAANCFMKSVVAQRRRKGLCGSVIDISRVVGVGYIEREAKATGKLTEKMIERMIEMSLPMSERDLHQLFAEAIVAGRPGPLQDASITTGIRTFEIGLPSTIHGAVNVKISHFITRKGNSAATQNQDVLGDQITMKSQIDTANSLEEINQIFKMGLSQRIKAILQVTNGEQINETSPIIDLGLDSLMAVEIRNWFLQETDGIDLPVLMILGGATIAELAEDALTKLPPDLQTRFNERDSKESIDKDARSTNPSTTSSLASPKNINETDASLQDP